MTDKAGARLPINFYRCSYRAPTALKLRSYAVFWTLFLSPDFAIGADFILVCHRAFSVFVEHHHPRHFQTARDQFLGSVSIAVDFGVFVWRFVGAISVGRVNFAAIGVALRGLPENAEFFSPPIPTAIVSPKRAFRPLTARPTACRP